MKKCKNCGAELEENAKFCEECGTRVVESNSSEASISENRVEGKKASSKKKEVKKKRKSLNKRERTIVFSGIAIILFIFLSYQLGSTVYSQENQTDRIIEAISSKDADQLARVTVSDDPDFELTAENLEGFTRYLAENPNYLRHLVSELEDYNYSDPFLIEKTGKKLFFFDSYDLVLTPLYGLVYTNEEGVKVSLDEEELFVSEEADKTVEVGPFAPGFLTFTAEAEVNGFPFEVTQEVTWFNYDNYVDLSLTGDYFSIKSDLDDATVYINDKEIGQLEEGYGEFGPIQIEEGMELHISQKFGDEEVLSDKVSLTKENDYYEFSDLVLGSTSDAVQVLKNSYYTASRLTKNYKNEVDDYNDFYDPEGPAYEDQRLSFLSFGESSANNEEISGVNFDVTVQDAKRISPDSFDINYEVTYTTNYTYNSGKENSLRHYKKEATILFKPTKHPNRDYDIYIHEIRNEELLYEEGEEVSTDSASAESKTEEELASAAVDNFVRNIPKAVNNNDFSALSSYIDSSSAFYNEQSSFVEKTHNRGISEKLDSLKITEVSADGKTAKVSTNEKFIITKEGSDSTSDYKAHYDLKKIKGNYLITKLVIK